MGFSQEDVEDVQAMGSSIELGSERSLPPEYLMETSPQPESLVRLMALFGMRAKEAQVVLLQIHTLHHCWKRPLTQNSGLPHAQ